MTRQLQPVPLVSPGFAGLNKQESGQTSTTGPQFALELQNAVFDDANRVAARKGWITTAPTGLSANETIDVLFEYINASGVSVLIAVDSAFDIFSSANGGVSWTTRTGALTPPNSNIQFVNFNGSVLGIQDGEDIIEWDGVAASFTSVVESGGAQPTGAAGLSAFGRVWSVDSDGQTVKYSGLLDQDDWLAGGVGGSGAIDLRNVWTLGMDTVQALHAFGSTLIVFGKRHIVFYTDGSGSTLGVDPSQMYVSDTIEGTGTSHRDSVVQIGDDGDVWFLSDEGVQSLQRVQSERTNPLFTVTNNIRDFLLLQVQGETGRIHASHNSIEGWYLLNLPTQGAMVMLDTKLRLEDGTVRTAEWIGLQPMCMWTTVFEATERTLFGFEEDIGVYSGSDDGGSSYRFVYASPHLDLGAPMNEKLPKRLGTISVVSGTQTLIYKWGFDFGGLTRSLSQPVAGATGAEYGTAEYGANGVRDNTDPSLVAGVDISEYGGTLFLRILKVPADGRGRFVQVGLEIEIENATFALQELDIYAKVGRIA